VDHVCAQEHRKHFAAPMRVSKYVGEKVAGETPLHRISR
jgi:hypothetical protein